MQVRAAVFTHAALVAPSPPTPACCSFLCVSATASQPLSRPSHFLLGRNFVASCDLASRVAAPAEGNNRAICGGAGGIYGCGCGWESGVRRLCVRVFLPFFVRKGSGVAAGEQESLVTRMSWGCTLSPPEVRGHGRSHPPTKPVTLNGRSLSAQLSTEEAEMEKTFGRELPADSDRVCHTPRFQQFHAATV